MLGWPQSRIRFYCREFGINCKRRGNARRFTRKEIAELEYMKTQVEKEGRALWKIKELLEELGIKKFALNDDTDH